MAWSWPAWFVSVGAVVVSGLIAWREGQWTKRPGLGIGFANHGGMWGDLLLLPFANAVIVPHLTVGPWIAAAVAVSTAASLFVHAHWYRRGGASGDHMWPSRMHGSWIRDLSRSGWAHVIYVVGELTVVVGFAIHAMPAEAVVLVAAVFTIHVPLGLLQPRYFVSRHIATMAEQPLLLPCLAALWITVAMKW